MRVAAFDLGTNTFLCLVADVDSGGIARVLSDEAEVVRLGQGMDKAKSFHPEALRRAEETLTRMRKTVDGLGVDRVIAVATSAARDAANREKFFAITEKLRIPTQVVSGDIEARLTFAGGTFDQKDRDGLAVVDIGGGSTEIIFRAPDGSIRGQSLDIGAVRLTERWVSAHPVPDQERESIQKDIQNHLQIFKNQTLANHRAEVKNLVAVAGTPTTLTALMLGKPFAENSVHGYKMRKDVLAEWIHRLAAMTVSQRQALPGMQKGREDVLVAGAMILLAVMELFSLSELTVSTKGVRYGLALQAARGEI